MVNLINSYHQEDITTINFFNRFIDTKIKDQKIQGRDNFDTLTPQDAPIHPQLDLFKEDWKHHAVDAWTQCKIESLKLVKIIGTLVIGPLGFIADIFRYVALRSISQKTFQSNVIEIPLGMGKAALQGVLFPFLVADKVVRAISTGAGNLLWHGGEALVNKLRQINCKDITEATNKTILSDRRKIRHIVYQSIGVTALSAVALCIPILPIQMVALAILSGSIYGTLNNLVTNRECPEYYTMGHYYDGAHVRGHAIKSMEPNLKAIISGCYATTMVTRIAGYALSAASTLPFVASTVPLAISVAMVAGSVFLGLGVAHIVSRIARNSELKFKKDMETLASGLGVSLDDSQNAQYLRDNLLHWYNNANPEKKDELKEVAQRVEAHNIHYDAPLKYQVGWHGNNIRNITGYITAGVGTVAVIVTTVCLRIFVF